MSGHIRHLHKFKFYLNASHSVFFNGIKGQAHPHTWEFGLKILDLGDSLIEFSVYENALKQLFEPYQNQILNNIEPFNEIVPTLENMTDFFGEQLRYAVRRVHGELLEIEGSETPTRSYLVDYSQDDSAISNEKIAEKDTVEDAFDTLLQTLRIEG